MAGLRRNFENRPIGNLRFYSIRDSFRDFLKIRKEGSSRMFELVESEDHE